MKPLWPHQQRGLTELLGLIDSGVKEPICLTAPTGMGKTRLMIELIMVALDRHWPVALYSDRRLLTDQLHRELAKAGIDHGVRSAEWVPQLDRRVQICSIQTETERVFRKQERPLHPARLVIIDEAHKNKSDTAGRLIEAHLGRGATVVGPTATPLDIGHIYKHLVVAGTNSEGRKCGALMACHTYGPDEPDMRKFKPSTKTGEYTENDVKKAIMSKTIFGRVCSWWRRLNPDQRPAILFAPGVGESRWFVDRFTEAGVRTAHIDGDDIYLDGKDYKSDPKAREDLIGMVRAGDVKVLCNRFVLREGIDIPELYHCIFATVFGSVVSYLQAGGRLMRYHPSLPGHVVVQDHGGNWWRHGSLNADRSWQLKQSAYVYGAMRAKQIREKKEPEPIVCPACFRGRFSGDTCPACGHRAAKKARMVVQTDGSLKPLYGDIFKPRVVKMKSDTQKKWDQMYYRAKRADMNFNQAEGLFFVENHYWPPHDLNLMPTDDWDWFRKVKEVGQQKLTGYDDPASIFFQESA